MTPRRLRSLSWPVLVLSLSLSTAAAQDPVPRTPSTAADASVVLVDGPAGALLWERTTPAVQPRYPRAPMRAGVSGCVTIGFFIEPDGTTSGFQALKATTTAREMDRRQASLGMFASAAAVAASQARYRPGPANPDRVRGFDTMKFEFSADRGLEAADCAIDDVKAFLERAATR